MRPRDALKTIVIAGATATVGGARNALRAANLLENTAKATGSRIAAGTSTFSPKYFSQNEFAVISRLADLIIPRDRGPGTLDAAVPEFIDLQVSEMPAAQTEFSGAVQWLDRFCTESHSIGFLDCSPEQQYKSRLGGSFR